MNSPKIPVKTVPVRDDELDLVAVRLDRWRRDDLGLGLLENVEDTLAPLPTLVNHDKRNIQVGCLQVNVEVLDQLIGGLIEVTDEDELVPAEE